MYSRLPDSSIARRKRSLALKRLPESSARSSSATFLSPWKKIRRFSFARTLSFTGSTVFRAWIMVDPYVSFIQAARAIRRDSVVSSSVDTPWISLILAVSYLALPVTPITYPFRSVLPFPKGTVTTTPGFISCSISGGIRYWKSRSTFSCEISMITSA